MIPGPREKFALDVNKRFFYGWVMVVVAMAGYFASGPGQSHIFSVFILPLSTDLGLDQTEISLAYALATLAAAFGLPYIGKLIDRYGMRQVVLITTTLLGFAAIAFGRVQGLIMLGLLFGALRFLGQGTLMLSSSNLVAQWFSKKRGFAASLMALGFSESVALHPPLAQWLIDQVGWRDAWLWLGIATWVLYLPLVFFLVQNKPEDIGLLPDGDSPGGTAAAADEAGGKPKEAEIGLTSGEALRTPAFWITALALASFSMLVTALFFYQVSIFQT
ncbi:MAG: MFS transporter, partial [Geminicoccaceae bacterium]